MTNRKIAEIGAVSAAAIAFGYVETLIPAVVPVPGVKLGLSNSAVLFAMYRIDKKSAGAVICVKVIVSALLFSGVQSMIYAAGGGLLSFVAMCASKRLLPVRYVSTAGGMSHTTGQLAAAALVLKSTSVFWYFPYLLTGGAITGFLLGTVTEKLLKATDKYCV